jgi:hypothetical protein
MVQMRVGKNMDCYINATNAIDADHPSITEQAYQLTYDSTDNIDRAKRLFYFVRDIIKYNPYLPRFQYEHFRASSTLQRMEGFCIQKAVLLIALCRALLIPSRLGFAVIRNHLLPEKLASMLLTNDIPDHGYTEIFLNGKWVKATPAFDIETCEKNSFIPVEFDGLQDAIFPSQTIDGKPHIGYIKFLGHYEDVPLEEITEWVMSALTPEAKTLTLGISRLTMNTHVVDEVAAVIKCIKEE